MHTCFAGEKSMSTTLEGATKILGHGGQQALKCPQRSLQSSQWIEWFVL